MARPQQRQSNPNSPARRWGRKGLLLANVAAAVGLGFALRGDTSHPASARTPAVGQNTGEKTALPTIEAASPARPREIVPAPRRAPRTVEEWKTVAQEARKSYLGRTHTPLPEKKVDEICKIVSHRQGIDSALLKALFKVESNFDPEAVGPTFDLGAGQLNPIVLAELQQKGKPVGNPFDPIQNLTGAATQLWELQRIAATQTIGGAAKGFSQHTRAYEYAGKKWSFAQLPEEIQIGILASMYNQGPGKTFTRNNYSKQGYDAQRIAQFDYAQKIIRYWKQYKEK